MFNLIICLDKNKSHICLCASWTFFSSQVSQHCKVLFPSGRRRVAAVRRQLWEELPECSRVGGHDWGKAQLSSSSAAKLLKVTNMKSIYFSVCHFILSVLLLFWVSQSVVTCSFEYLTMILLVSFLHAADLEVCTNDLCSAVKMKDVHIIVIFYVVHHVTCDVSGVVWYNAVCVPVVKLK